MQINDDELRRELADVPEVPDTIYGLVERRLRRRVQFRRWTWAVAVSLALVVGGEAYRAARAPATDSGVAAVTDELDRELREISAFLNGETIEDELETYALVSFDDL